MTISPEPAKCGDGVQKRMEESEQAGKRKEWIGKERMGCMEEGENDRRAQRGIHVALSLIQ